MLAVPEPLRDSLERSIPFPKGYFSRFFLGPRPAVQRCVVSEEIAKRPKRFVALIRAASRFDEAMIRDETARSPITIFGMYV